MLCSDTVSNMFKHWLRIFCFIFHIIFHWFITMWRHHCTSLLLNIRINTVKLSMTKSSCGWFFNDWALRYNIRRSFCFSLHDAIINPLVFSLIWMFRAGWLHWWEIMLIQFPLIWLLLGELLINIFFFAYNYWILLSGFCWYIHLV